MIYLSIPIFISMFFNFGIGPLLIGLVVIKLLKRANELKLFAIGFSKTLLVNGIPLVLFSLVGIRNTTRPYLNATKYVVELK